MFGLPTLVRFKKYKVVHEEFCCRLKNPYLSTCGACIVENGWATGFPVGAASGAQAKSPSTSQDD